VAEHDSTRSQVTRADVARYASVSAAVVSYVVNGGPKNVAPATAARVLEAIRVLGYRPNANARALRTGTTQMLGLVLPDSSNPFFASLGHAVEAAAAERGHVVVLTNSRGDDALHRRLVANLASRQVDGLLLTGATARADHAAGTGIPTVLLDQHAPLAGCVTVGPDSYAGAYEGVAHLIGHGHRTVALITGDSGFGTTDSRERAWLQATRDAGRHDGLVARAPFTFEGGYTAGNRLLAAAHPPTAIFASSDMQAIGLLRAIHESGRHVPHDVAVVSFDGTDETEFCWPRLTVVRQPVELMARAAVDAVLTRRTAAHHAALPMDLIARRSCGCADAGP
jgi:LacI family transcriptional regulator